MAEGLFRAVHLFHPLERPPALGDNLEFEWIEGRDKPLDGVHRLYIYKPGSTGSTYGHPVRVNRYGFRDGEWVSRDGKRSERRHNGAFRILVLGDSLTMGQGVAEEERFTNVLSARMSARYPLVPVEVVNLGVQGFETVQEERILYRMWKDVQPDLTIVAFYVNDTNVTYEGTETNRIPLPPQVRSVLERSLMFRVLEPWYDPPYRWLAGLPTYEEVQMRARNVKSKDWLLFAQAVKNIGRWVTERSDLAPMVMFLTHEPNKQDDFYWSVRRTFEGNGFHWVEPRVARYEPVSRFEFHPNAAMHHAYAEALFEAIPEPRYSERSFAKAHS
jgi:lysophospholipase L1-like esterase